MTITQYVSVAVYGFRYRPMYTNDENHFVLICVPFVRKKSLSHIYRLNLSFNVPDKSCAVIQDGNLSSIEHFLERL